MAYFYSILHLKQEENAPSSENETIQLIVPEIRIKNSILRAKIWGMIYFLPIES